MISPPSIICMVAKCAAQMEQPNRPFSVVARNALTPLNITTVGNQRSYGYLFDFQTSAGVIFVVVPCRNLLPPHCSFSDYGYLPLIHPFSSTNCNLIFQCAPLLPLFHLLHTLALSFTGFAEICAHMTTSLSTMPSTNAPSITFR